MTIAGELINLLGFKLEGEANLKKFNQGMNDAESMSKRSADRIKKLGIAAGVTTTGMIAMGTAAFKNAAAFERQMERIGITAGASADKVKAASDTVTQLSRDLAMPIDQAVAGLDTLVASGLSLEDAMAFLPSVLATAQAAGAATEDIANTAIKASSALGIQAKDMQNAFDIMVAGGKAGQFELKDMAQYIPELANSFASLGYSGEDGLKQLIALMQTLREDTGSASAAATNAQNIFGKMFSNETARAFKKFGIDLRDEMEKAKAAGEDAVTAFTRISNEAIKGDLTKLPLLFSDQQFRLGMQSLMTGAESMERFAQALNSADVEGGVFRDLDRILSGTQAKIDKMTTSWDIFMKSLGGSLADPISSALDTATDYLSFDQAITEGLKKRGMDDRAQKIWRANNWFFSEEERGRAAREGGYIGSAEDRRVRDTAPVAYEVLGRMPRRPITRTPERSPLAAGEGGMAAAMGAVQGELAAMNSNLADMTARASGDATITDARQDNRTFPMNVNAPVTVQVQQATQAPMAVGNAISGAIGQAATAQQSRIEAEPAQP